MLYALLADAAAAPAAPPAAPDLGPFGGPNAMMLVMMLGILFMVVVVLPGSRKAKKQEEAMRAGLKRGAKVVTLSGIIGTVVGAQDGSEEITLRSEDTKLRVLRSSIVKVLGADEAEAAKG